MNDGTYSPDYSLTSVDLQSFKNNLVDIIQQNKERWKELAAQGRVVYEALLPSLSVLTLPLGFWLPPLLISSLMKYTSLWLPFDYS